MYLLKFEFHWSRIERGDCICYILPNAKRLFLSLTPKVYEEGISVSIHHFRSPLIGRVNSTHSLVRRVSRGMRCVKLCKTFSRVSRPLCTMLSAISTAGMRPEKVALVYPYVTFAIYLSP